MNNEQKRISWVEPLLGIELRTLSTGSAFVPKSYTADGVLVRIGTKGVHITIAFDELQSAHGALFQFGDLSLQELGGRPQHRSYVLAMLASAYNTHVSVKPVRITLDPVIDLQPDRALHPDQLAEKLAAQKQLGDEAEAAAINYEKERLEQAGRKDLADLVQWISLENCAAGYDIRSFNVDGTDRFIEVKGSRGNKLTFELSANELAVARHLGDRYYLYMVLNTGNKKQEIEIIQDLARAFDEKRLQYEPTSLRVEYADGCPG